MSGHGHSSADAIRTYALVFGALLVLMAVTIFAAQRDFGQWNTAIAMLIATTKATLIVLYFMHVKDSSRWVALLFGLSLYMVAIGATLLFADYFTRGMSL